MHYVSTRAKSGIKSFEDVLLAGLADDGGLYLPEKLPFFDEKAIENMRGLAYEDIAFEIISSFVGDAFDASELKELIKRAYAAFNHKDRAPLRQFDNDFYVLELFHGPTRAFKDFAMQLIGQMFQKVLSRRQERITIVGATSGDTGAAAIEAFRGLKAVNLFILYPEKGVSDIQRRQMTCAVEDNVQALAIDDDFDTCQAYVKALFNDHDFRNRVHLSGVNSINWGRIMAQIVYYFTSACALRTPLREIDISVPSANFGDIYAGFLAQKMGLPIARLGIATNQNDILHRCLETGDYRPNKVRPSLSPSMDIQISSNFERVLFDMSLRDSDEICTMMAKLKSDGHFSVPCPTYKRLREVFFSGSVSEEETLDEIKNIYNSYGEIICPHSAIGTKIAQQFKRKNVPMIALATAHWAKFPTAVKRAIGKDSLSLPKDLRALQTRRERVFKVENNFEAVKKHIELKVNEK